MKVYGIILILETEHILQTIYRGEYYSGTLTALLFPIIAIFFWRELIKNLRKRG